MPDGRRVRACGLVTARQQPPTAHGTVFVTIEDESGPISVIVPQALRDTRRAVLVGARLLAVEGRWQKRDSVGHLIAQRLADLSDWLGGLDTASRDFR